MVKGGRNHNWKGAGAIILALVGALVAVGGSTLVFTNQAQMTGAAIWPLPGGVLMDWAILGLLGFFASVNGSQPAPTYWRKVAWFVPGALIPLVILGAFSIGLLVFISVPFFLVAAILIALQTATKWLEHLKHFLFGVVCNLGILVLLIALGGQAFH